MMNRKTETPKKRQLGAWKAPSHCLGCDEEGTFSVEVRPSYQLIQGEKIHYETEKYYCNACEAEWLSPVQASVSVRHGVELFQKKYDLLIASHCRERRKKVGMTQDELAEQSKVGIATIKRLEGGVHIVSQANNQAIESVLVQAEDGKAASEEGWAVIFTGCFSAPTPKRKQETEGVWEEKFEWDRSLTGSMDFPSESCPNMSNHQRLSLAV